METLSKELKSEFNIINKETGLFVRVKYVREMPSGYYGCVEVDNTSNFHAVHPSEALADNIMIDPETGERTYEIEDVEAEFEVDQSYFIYDPEGGGGSDESDEEGEGDDSEGESGEGDEDGDPQDGEGEGEESDKDGDESDGDGKDGKPSDKDGKGKGEGEGKESDKEGKDGKAGKGEGKEGGKDNGERGDYSPGDPEGGSPAEIIKQHDHPEEIGSEFIVVKKKKTRF